MTTLPAGESWRIDRRSAVEVLLDNEIDALVSVDDAALLAGANLCQIGEELLQFGQADPIGPQRFRLTRLVRGWHGTEWACAAHGGDERFALIDLARLVPVEINRTDVGQTLDLRAAGSGDDVPAQATRTIDGRAMMPLSPVHGRILPLGEEAEIFFLRISTEGVILREWETSGPTALYGAAEKAVDLAAAGPSALLLEIRQKGTWGLSHPLVLTVS